MNSSRSSELIDHLFEFIISRTGQNSVACQCCLGARKGIGLKDLLQELFGDLSRLLAR